MNSIFDLEKYGNKLSDKNKRLLNHLKKNGIDGQKLYEKICDVHGWEWKIPVSDIDKSKHKAAKYARTWLTSLVNNEAITDKEKDYLCKIKSRLQNEYSPYEKSKNGFCVKVPSFNLGVGPACDVGKYPAAPERTQTEKPALRDTQIWGRQAADIFRYIKRYINKNRNDKKYSDNDIYNFIAGIYLVLFGLKFKQTEIKKFCDNYF